MKKDYIGDLEPKLMTHYRKLVQQENYDKRGDSSRIIFFDKTNHAIKYPIRYDPISKIELRKEYFIGMDLMTNGINVPQMYAVNVGRKSEKPFLVMEKLDLVEIKPYQVREAEIQFNKQIQVARDLGYCPLDVSLELDLNCGWDKGRNALCLYDFESWEGPRVDEIMGRNLK